MVFYQNVPILLKCTGFVSNFMWKQQAWLNSTWWDSSALWFVWPVWRAWEWTSHSDQCTNTSTMNFSVKNLQFHPYQSANQC